MIIVFGYVAQRQREWVLVSFRSLIPTIEVLSWTEMNQEDLKEGLILLKTYCKLSWLFSKLVALNHFN